ncbi:hypothetical protein ACIBCN_44355 [Nocardia sp. NPDC051052]|uniref:hypothetical protein n=1 Tax=Nocardia sp. NPDC051052 TaxID=3364322 RepID=UPI003794A6A1
MTATEQNRNRATAPTANMEGVHVNGWITPRLEEVLQRAVDIANEFGYRQVHVEHVALAIAEDPESPTSRDGATPLTAQQWRRAFLDALPPVEPTDRLRPRRGGTDIFYWRTSH